MQPISNNQDPYFKTLAQVQSSNLINGLPFDKLESRVHEICNLKPKIPFSFQRQSFRHYLETSWKIAEHFKVSHVQLATHLREIIKEIDNACEENPEKQAHPIMYYFPDSEEELWGECFTMLLCKKKACETDYDVFIKDSQKETSIENYHYTSESGLEKKVSILPSCNTEYIIRNCAGVEVSLNLTSLGHIEELGFYGGKIGNKLTVFKILALFFNQKVKHLKKQFKIDYFECERINPSPFLKSSEEIAQLTSINGLSIEKIEERARPGGFSQVGFLEKEESFLEVLKRDWKTVEDLGTSFAELAAHVRNILKLAYVQRKRIIEYNPECVEGNTLKVDIQRYNVMLLSTRGYQYDIFTQTLNSSHFLKPQNYLKSDQTTQEVSIPNVWSDEPIITNLSNNKSITTPQGTLGYFEELGFCEGGSNSNPYRLDPQRVYSVLTGTT